MIAPKKHRTELNKILAHPGLNPNRAMLGIVLSMWLDADEGREKDILSAVLVGVFVSPKRVNWTDEGDPGVPNATTRVDIDATNKMKEALKDAFGDLGLDGE